MNLAQMSASAAVMIAAILVLRWAAKHRLPKRTFSALWGVALLRLTVPFSAPSPLSVYALLARLRAPGESAAAHAGLPAGQGGHTALLLSAAQPQAARPSLWIGLWAAGAVLCALYFAVAYIRSRMRFASARPVENAYAAAFLAEKKMKRQIALRQSARLPAPLSYGVLHPVILMPEGTDWADTACLRFVLQHEYVHIRRFDGVAKLLLAAALAVHWFNPFVWIMYVLANRDIELACDEAVVRSFGAKARSAYALALIGMEEKKSAFMPLVSGFSKNAIEERISAIMKIQKATAWSLLAACCVVGGTAAAFATSAPPEAAPQAVTDHIAGNPSPAPQALTQQEVLAAYGPYGVSFDANGKMLFDGEPVRLFWDGVELGDGGQATRYEYWEPSGTVDVHTVRSVIDNGDGSVDPFGELLGVRRYTQQEFDRRDINVPSASPGQVTEAIGSGGDQAGGRTIAEIFARYETYGVRYEAGNVYWNERPVSAFVDESPDGGVFTYQSTDGGAISVRAVYDAAGALSGVEEIAA